jgi:hypothetical protein
MICGITGPIEYLVAPGSAQSVLARACDDEGIRKKFDCEIRGFSLVAPCFTISVSAAFNTVNLSLSISFSSERAWSS